MASGKKILFFIAGSNPTDEEKAEAAKLNTSMFRNASYYNEFDAIEICDAIAGLAPEAYRNRFQYVSVAKDQTSPTPVVTPPDKPSWSKGA